MANKTTFILLTCTILGLLQACTGIPVETRIQQADQLASTAGWNKQFIEAGGFAFVAYLPVNITQSDNLRVYMEGDGHAWRNRRTPSTDPTPVNPVALKLATQDRQPSVYLARPCQYIQAKNSANCHPRYWTTARYSEEVINAVNIAVSKLVEQFKSKKLVLVGFSGGGAVASLVASRRNDVSKLVTVAGNLDHVAWTSHHGITPLNRSLNPADYWQILQELPQKHFVGASDTVVPISIVNSYAQSFESRQNLQIELIKEYDHHCCWAENWQSLSEHF